MLTIEYNALPLDQRSKTVFNEGKLIGISQDHPIQKGFFYKLKGLKVDVIYDKTRNRLFDVKVSAIVFLMLLATWERVNIARSFASLVILWKLAVLSFYPKLAALLFPLRLELFPCHQKERPAFVSLKKR